MDINVIFRSITPKFQKDIVLLRNMASISSILNYNGIGLSPSHVSHGRLEADLKRNYKLKVREES